MKAPGLASFASRAMLLLGLLAGCSDFAERSCRMLPEDALLLSHRSTPTEHDTLSTRGWLQLAHRELCHVLPPEPSSPLLTEQLVGPRGQSADVFGHFGINPNGLQNLIMNNRGLKYSAQAASRQYFIERQAPAWPGFEDIWIPITTYNGAELALSGRMGYARDARGNVVAATCLVILPGLYGDQGVKRSQDLACPLRQAGYHVLALELRGHGQTEHRYPQMHHAFGVLETDDLMQVSDWLERQAHISGTGLIGCCWNANIALLAAWLDGRGPDDAMIAPDIRRKLLACDPHRRRFSAGMIALSPVVSGEALMDELDRPRSRWKHPIYAAIQDTIRDRTRQKGYPSTSSLRCLMDEEYRVYNTPGEPGMREAYSMLRLVAYKGQPAGDKLEFARMPVLIVHGADDPLIPAQDIADMIAGVRNPRVAALVLPSGGHVGFAGYAPRYYLSLIINFFDPVRGAAAGLASARADGRCS